MNPELILAAFRHEIRSLAWPGETLATTLRITRRSRGEETTVTAYALDESNADAAIDREKARGKPFEWKAFSFDEPADLVDRLAKAGFEIGSPEALVVYDLSQGLDQFKEVLEVRRVRSEQDLADYRGAAEAAFGRDHAPTAAALANALEAKDETHQAYVTYVNDVPASVGRLYTHPESLFAGLYGGGTIPDIRGRGLYRMVVGARACVAAARGARYLQVDALPTSLPILLRLGFVQIAESRPCLYSPSL